MLAHPEGVAKITPNLLRKEKIHGGISDIFEWIRRDGCARRNEVRAATAGPSFVTHTPSNKGMGRFVKN